MSRNISLIDQRAIKITELNEELEKGREIIKKFVWPPDYDKRMHEAFIIKSAHFAGCQIPVFDNDERKEKEHDFEDKLEQAYWEFDSAKSGNGKYKGHPQSERDAFKMMVRGLINNAG